VKSIRTFGLLQPIIVCLLPDGKYRLIAGRRRVLACAILQMAYTKAVVLDDIPDPAIANAIWATENLVRHETPSAELAATFEALLMKYGSVEEIARQTGIPADKVSRYLSR
jgi:ParB family chromosome partitioning protein